jgi:hypothetical protein
MLFVDTAQAKDITEKNTAPVDQMPREYLKTPRYVQIGEMYNSGISASELAETERYNS